MDRHVTAADELLERHPWLGYVLVVLMALLMSFEGVAF